MISFVIKFITIVFVIVSVCTFEKKKSIIERIFKAIKNAYYELVNQQGPNIKISIKVCRNNVIDGILFDFISKMLLVRW